MAIIIDDRMPKEPKFEQVVCLKCNRPIIDAGKTVDFDLQPWVCIGYCENRDCERFLVIIAY